VTLIDPLPPKIRDLADDHGSVTGQDLRACPETGSVAGDRICFRANEV
jgi:hypothetical protein